MPVKTCMFKSAVKMATLNLGDTSNYRFTAAPFLHRASHLTKLENTFVLEVHKTGFLPCIEMEKLCHQVPSWRLITQTMLALCWWLQAGLTRAHFWGLGLIFHYQTVQINREKSRKEGKKEVEKDKKRVRYNERGSMVLDKRDTSWNQGEADSVLGNPVIQQHHLQASGTTFGPLHLLFV